MESITQHQTEIKSNEKKRKVIAVSLNLNYNSISAIKLNVTSKKYISHSCTRLEGDHL